MIALNSSWHITLASPLIRRIGSPKQWNLLILRFILNWEIHLISSRKSIFQSLFSFLPFVLANEKPVSFHAPALIIIRSLFRCRVGTLSAKKQALLHKQNPQWGTKWWKITAIQSCFASAYLILIRGCAGSRCWFWSQLFELPDAPSIQQSPHYKGAPNICREWKKPFVRSLVIKLIAFRRSILSLRLICNNFSLSG